MVKKRNRFKQTTSLAERLTAQAGRLRERARKLPPGAEQTTLWRKIRQAETALRIEAWLSRPGAFPRTMYDLHRGGPEESPGEIL